MKIALIGLLIILFFYPSAYSFSPAKNGKILYAGEERLPLTGEWAFYWEQLLPPGAPEYDSESPVYVNIVSYWNSHDGIAEDLAPFGYATYRLVVEADREYQVAFDIPGFNLSYALYLNGELLSADGVVATSKDRYVPDWTVNTKAAQLRNGDNELVVQIANFDHSNGGFFKAIVIGDPDVLFAEKEMNLIVETFNIGSALLIGFFFVGLFIYLRDDRSFLFYGLFVISYALYISNYGQYVFGTVFPAVPSWIKLKVTYLTMFLTWVFYTLFLSELFREDFHKIVRTLALYIAWPLCLLTILAPMHIYSRTLVPFTVLGIPYIIYGFYITIVARLKRRGGSLFIFAGLSLCFTAILLMSAYHFNLILTKPNAISVLFTFTFLIMSFAFAEKIGKAFSSVKTLQLETATQKEEIEHQAGELLKLDEVKSRFFANISHEFRTPLTLISGPVQELKRMHQDAGSVRNLSAIETNATRLLKLVNQILELARLDAGHHRLHKEYADITRLLGAAVDSFEQAAQELGVNLKYESAGRVSGWVDIDAFEKIAVNLISNALKFTPSGGEVKVGLANDGDQMIVTVSDTGIGVSPDQLPYVFDRFYSTESDRQASSGIGLSLVKALVTSLGGSAAVTSEEGQGTTFTVSLPLGGANEAHHSLNEKEQPGRQDQVKSSAMEMQDLHGERPGILIIEDNDDVRQFLADMLQADFDTILAIDGANGLEAAREHMPDGIICDIMMPGMDGYEVCQRLKLDEKTSHIPIVMLTARADMESKLKGLDSAADDYLTKPVNREELLLRLQNLLNNRKLLRDKYRQETVIRPQEIPVSSVDKVFLEKVMSAVNTYLGDEDFSVETLAREVSMSKSQLNRKLQALIGQSPNQLIRQFRLQRAYELLEGNAGSVSEIAFLTGFSSHNYFNAVFKEAFGIVPSEVPRKTKG